MLIVWDSISATPVRTFLNPHPNGIMCLDLSMDNQYLVTLGKDQPQTIALWDWTNEKEEGPIVSLQFKYVEQFLPQHWVKFNPNDPSELATNGSQRVVFLNWEKGVSQFQYYAPRIPLKEMSNNKKESKVELTKTVFIPNQETAVTATNNGMILVWDRSLIIEGLGEQNEKRVIKTVPLNNQGKPINILTTHLNYLVCGNYEGTIRFYDFNFKIAAWFEECHFSNVKSISFSNTEPKMCSEEGF